MSDTIPAIYGKISDIMRDMPAIGKDKRNQQQGFAYRGIDDVMNVLNPLLVKHGVFLSPEVLDRQREERVTKSGGTMAYTVLKVKYTFYAVCDGSSISTVVMGEGMDSADKSTNKAMSIAMKYALFQLLCIPTEEMIDPDSETPPESEKPLLCSYCKAVIKVPNGSTAASVKEVLLSRFGDVLCHDCRKANKTE